MSFKSQRNLIYIVISVLTLIVFCIRDLTPLLAHPENYRSFSLVMAVYIGVTTLLFIITLILFHFVYATILAVKGDKQSTAENISETLEADVKDDERDQIIELRVRNISGQIFGFSFIIGLALLGTGAPLINAFLLQFFSFYAAIIISYLYSIYLYER